MHSNHHSRAGGYLSFNQQLLQFLSFFRQSADLQIELLDLGRQVCHDRVLLAQPCLQLLDRAAVRLHNLLRGSLVVEHEGFDLSLALSERGFQYGDLRNKQPTIVSTYAAKVQCFIDCFTFSLFCSSKSRRLSSAILSCIVRSAIRC